MPEVLERGQYLLEDLNDLLAERPGLLVPLRVPLYVQAERLCGLLLVEELVDTGCRLSERLLQGLHVLLGEHVHRAEHSDRRMEELVEELPGIRGVRDVHVSSEDGDALASHRPVRDRSGEVVHAAAELVADERAHEGRPLVASEGRKLLRRDRISVHVLAAEERRACAEGRRDLRVVRVELAGGTLWPSNMDLDDTVDTVPCVEACGAEAAEPLAYPEGVSAIVFDVPPCAEGRANSRADRLDARVLHAIRYGLLGVLGALGEFCTGRICFLFGRNVLCGVRRTEIGPLVEVAEHHAEAHDVDHVLAVRIIADLGVHRPDHRLDGAHSFSCPRKPTLVEGIWIDGCDCGHRLPKVILRDLHRHSGVSSLRLGVPGGLSGTLEAETLIGFGLRSLLELRVDRAEAALRRKGTYHPKVGRADDVEERIPGIGPAYVEESTAVCRLLRGQALKGARDHLEKRCAPLVLETLDALHKRGVRRDELHEHHLRSDLGRLALHGVD